jgi:poly(3-hydroxybutyrate) depolymerase
MRCGRPGAYWHSPHNGEDPMKNALHFILIGVVMISALSACTGAAKGGGDSTVLDGVGAPEDGGAEDTSDASADISDAPETETSSDDAPDSSDAGGPPPQFLGGDRPAPYYLPESYDPDSPIPVLVVLHGFTGNGAGTASWWQLYTSTAAAGIMLIVPEGTKNVEETPFWNATEFCCDFYQSKVDDVGYITGLIEEAMSHFSVDPTRVYLMGHSNGGFMAHRIACDRSDLITAIVNMAGATWYNPEDCTNPDPVSVLQVHGTWDISIFYGGLPPYEHDPNARPINQDGCLGASCGAEFGACSADVACAAMTDCFDECSTEHADNQDAKTNCNGVCWETGTPTGQILWMEALNCGASAGCYFAGYTKDSYGYASAEEGAARWAQINGCQQSTTEGASMDLIGEIPGPDTYPSAYEGCPTGLASEVWKILYGSHTPGFNNAWAPAVMEWLLAQQKPTP